MSSLKPRRTRRRKKLSSLKDGIIKIGPDINDSDIFPDELIRVEENMNSTNIFSPSNGLAASSPSAFTDGDGAKDIEENFDPINDNVSPRAPTASSSITDVDDPKDAEENFNSTDDSASSNGAPKASSSSTVTEDPKDAIEVEEIVRIDDQTGKESSGLKRRHFTIAFKISLVEKAKKSSNRNVAR